MSRPFLSLVVGACLVVVGGISGCGGASRDVSPDSGMDSSLDAGAQPEGDVDAGEGADASVEPDGDPQFFATSTYCERLAPFFCDFYLHCGRTSASSVEECRATFVETCNARYEVRYAQLEDAGLVRFSAEGFRACEAHLSNVSCDAQPLDLSGPCARLWRGFQVPGGACGLDVEGLVCAPGSFCRLGLDFCGSCEPHLALEAPCGDGGVCGPDAQCLEGRCQSRVLPGGACSGAVRCAPGATCVSGTCEGPTWVPAGQACGSNRRCILPAVCQAGVCRSTALLGESCSAEKPCGSGRCVTEGMARHCRTLLPNGESCAGPGDCQSTRCVEGVCAPLPGACFP